MTAIPDTPSSRLGEPDYAHVHPSKVEHGNQVDNCHHLKFRTIEGQTARWHTEHSRLYSGPLQTAALGKQTVCGHALDGVSQE